MTDHPHRRDFVRVLALGVTSAAIAPAARADDKEKPKDEKPKDTPTRPEADVRMDLILARYGPSLDDDARKAVRAEVESIVRRGEALRKFALSNGDGPLPVFTPYRG